MGIGTRLSFPSLEVRKNNDGSSHVFLHTESGDVYRLSRAVYVDQVRTFFIEGQTIEDMVVKESNGFSNGQEDGISSYLLTGKDGKRTYFAPDGRILGIVDRYGNTIKFEYKTLTYKIDNTTISKRLISKITDTVGRVVNMEYMEDSNYTVKPITSTNYGKEIGRAHV